MSILRSKHSGWTHEGKRTPYFGGGGGGGAPTSSTAYQTNLPEYAKPYVTNMLEATQRQLFEGTPTEGGGFEITGFKPYRPYSSNVQDYFAGFSPLQQQAQQAAGQLEVPGQIGQGSQMVGQAGLGALQAAQQARPLMGQALGYGAQGAGYGGMGAGYGAAGAGMSGMGFGAGSRYEQMATSPGAQAAYMSPYMQNVVDFQKMQALRDYQMGKPLRQAQAVGQGAFGGSRQAVQEAEAQRNLMSQLQGIQATGTQKAFEDAQRQMQFGSQLGLQGLGLGYQGLGMGIQGAQAGMQGAGLGLQGIGQATQAGQYGLAGLGQATQAGLGLGQLGSQQLAAQRDIIGLQSQMGAQQQALEQQRINQAIQDYATAQQYPLMQLGFMSNMLRGLPMQATTTQTYQATPSPLTQGLGVLAGAAGARQAGLFAEGGTIKGLAAGGVTNYANRGMVEANPSSGVVRGVREKLMMMTDEQLNQVAQSSASQEIRAMALQILRENKIREQAENQAQQSIAQDQQRGLPTPVSERAGLPAAPAGAMDTLNAASGGIVAFAGEDESLVEGSPKMYSLDPEKEMEMRQKYIDMFKRQREAAGVGAPKAGLADVLAKEKADVAEDRKQARGYELMRFGTRFATQTGPLLYAGSKALESTLPGMIESERSIKTREREINKGLADIAEGERLMKIGDIEGGNKLFNQAADRLSKEKIAGTKTPGNMIAYANNYLAERVAAGDTRDAATIRKEGMDNYMYLYGQAGPRAATAATTATTNLYDKARDNVDKSLSDNFNSPDNKELRRRQKEDKKKGTDTANTYLQELYRKEEQRLKGGQQAPAAPAPSGDKGNKPKEVIKLD